MTSVLPSRSWRSRRAVFIFWTDECFPLHSQLISDYYYHQIFHEIPNFLGLWSRFLLYIWHTVLKNTCCTVALCPPTPLLFVFTVNKTENRLSRGVVEKGGRKGSNVAVHSLPLLFSSLPRSSSLLGWKGGSVSCLLTNVFLLRMSHRKNSALEKSSCLLCLSDTQ